MTSRYPAVVVDTLRSICLAFPEVTEQPFAGHEAPSFRVRNKLFLMLREDGGSLTCKAVPGEQALLVEADPGRYFIPPYVGSKGWIGLRIDADTDWEEVAEMAEDSYRLIAPKRLVVRLDASSRAD
jgi:hypothetical protein